MCLLDMLFFVFNNERKLNSTNIMNAITVPDLATSSHKLCEYPKSLISQPKGLSIKLSNDFVHLSVLPPAVLAPYFLLSILSAYADRKSDFLFMVKYVKDINVNETMVMIDITFLTTFCLEIENKMDINKVSNEIPI